MNKFLIPSSLLLSAILVALTLIYNSGLKTVHENTNFGLSDSVLSESGFVLPVRWGSLGKELVASGLIDGQKFERVYSNRSGFSSYEKELLYSENNGNLVMTKNNAGYFLNLLWAFGLGNKNEILEKGQIMDSRYGGPQNFASTGGWTLAEGDTMDHYSRHQFVKLDAEEQILVERVSKNIYRPCCNNSAYFPDCNHGMAMLGLLELMAAQGVGEEEMYRIALRVNSFWFPDTYETIAGYLQSKNIDWTAVNSKDILGPNFSSVSGFQRILNEYQPPQKRGGASCGV